MDELAGESPLKTKGLFFSFLFIFKSGHSGCARFQIILARRRLGHALPAGLNDRRRSRGGRLLASLNFAPHFLDC